MERDETVSTGFRLKLALAAAGVIALAAAMIYFGRPAPRVRGADVASEQPEAPDVRSGSGVALGEGGGQPSKAAAPRRSLASAWRWLMGDGDAPVPQAGQPAGGAGSAGSGSSTENPTGEAPMIPPKFTLSERRPSRDPANDDSSPTLQKIIEVTAASPAQQGKIRDLWRKHEEARRELIAHMMPSVAPPEVKLKLELEAVDGEFEIALVRDVLGRGQIDRLLAEIHPHAP